MKEQSSKYLFLASIIATAIVFSFNLISFYLFFLWILSAASLLHLLKYDIASNLFSSYRVGVMTILVI